MPWRKAKGRHFNWNKRHFREDHDDGSGDHRTVNVNLHCRDHGRPRKSYGANTELIKKAVAMNLLPTPSGTASVRNTCLGLGETWVRITIVQGAMYPVNALQELINATLGTQMRFYNVCMDGRNAVLHAKIRQKQVTEFRKALQSLRDPNNGKDQLVTELTLVTEPRVPSSPSNLTTAQNIGSLLPEHWMQALRACFRERFQLTTRSLDLSSLHTEPTLLSQGLYLPLNRASVVHAMISILKDNGAQLTLLNLSNNRLTHLNSFSLLAASPDGTHAVSIERIDLSANPLNGIIALAGLHGIANLIELDISETPLASRFKQSDRTLATKLVKILPGLKRLNGEDLPQTVQFAIERDSGKKGVAGPPRIPLPPSVLGYFPSDEVRIPLLGFLKEYFTRFDMQPRGENIIPYYTSMSQMVMSTVPEIRQVGSSHHGNSNNFHSGTPIMTLEQPSGSSGTLLKTYLTTSRLTHPYFSHSRNLLRCRDESKRRELILCGPVSIAAFLDRLPPTEHPLESLTVDVTFHSDTQILFTVAGVFYELQFGNYGNNPTVKTVRKILRCFSRTMILVAPGGHIIQDDLIISNPSSALYKRYITDVASRSQSNVNDTPPAKSNSIGTPSVNPTSNIALLGELRQRTGMNEEFARQCLDEYSWNLEEAYTAFQTLNAAGKIPQNAFI